MVKPMYPPTHNERGENISNPIQLLGFSTDAYTKAIRYARKVSFMMDEMYSLPFGHKKTIGLDGLLGLIPVVGDLISLVISTTVIWQAVGVGVGGAPLCKMIGNVLLDFFVGLVPVIGDIFDVLFKANSRNAVLLEEALANMERQGDVEAFHLPQHRRLSSIGSTGIPFSRQVSEDDRTNSSLTVVDQSPMAHPALLMPAVHIETKPEEPQIIRVISNLMFPA
eukprot:GILJ01009199.1.p1 GENE.GILJ01009199.1~~GILJ01009199.1.p1  ORF type:complete len:223 (+),score=35.22 GILJ01009199.1:268-936(+)